MSPVQESVDGAGETGPLPLQGRDEGMKDEASASGTQNAGLETRQQYDGPRTLTIL